jgi:Glycosyl hydrolases family 2, TIM barrel domain/Glycosyl hydrolases family 2
MLEDIFIKPDIDNAKICVLFTKPEDCTKVAYSVCDGDQVVSNGTMDIPAETTNVSFEQDMGEFKTWSTEHPYLYKLKLELTIGIDVNDIEQTFGMTKIHIDNRKLFFNNMPFYIRAHIRGREAHDHPNLRGESKTEYYERNIRMSKAYGFNFIRFHSRIPEDEFLEAADRLGILCHVEIRKYYGKYQKERKLFDGDQTLVKKEDWIEAVLRLRNHPCVMVYCLGNEINSPGKDPRVKEIRELTREFDPTRLFLDTCSRGQYDRDTVDIDVQHMSYFAPFGKNYHMYNDTIHLAIYGSCTDKTMYKDTENYRTRREVPVKYPLIAHEVCHYNVLRDLYKLADKFKKYSCVDQQPWWVDELIKMIEAKGHKEQYQTMLEASTRFQYIWIKQNLESVRKSTELEGFHFLQLADTERYENANGLLDCFDDVKDIQPAQFLPFNSSSVIIADLPQRSFMENSKVIIPIYVSHYGEVDFKNSNFVWELKSKQDDTVKYGDTLEDIDPARGCVNKSCCIEVTFPSTDTPVPLKLSCTLTKADNTEKISNSWDMWLFPNRAAVVGTIQASIVLASMKLNKRYKVRNDATAHLMITDHFTDGVFEHLSQGKDVLMLYRIDETRDRQAPREKYYLPSTWERFKGIIWDRGHNCGGFFRDHPITEMFPNEKFVDWQLYHLIEDSEKIDLDDFPVRVEPIIEGVDKAVRDRFDVNIFNLSEFQYEYTMRKFAYLFELNVGKGRLLVTGMNFKGIETDKPEVCWMFESIISYMQSDKFKPSQTIVVNELSDYLLKKGASKRIKERMMTQYWQLDEAPLESKKYWEESEAWLREDD